MNRNLFVNLPVGDLKRSMDFFTELGFDFDTRFTDANAACMVVNGNSFVMLLAEDFFTQFTGKRIVDAATHTEVIVTLSADSRQQVDDLVNKAFEAGARPSADPVEHEGMYAWSFQDLDGHLWEVLHMDPKTLTE
ncbi:VOC family protein [Thermobifida halotolerans]|uniref:VOC family protein n=1 Tax=Thermobifida halotolerans TaxID=483545 RepID=A0A399G246_9ACTN|nr:VOC family protein [Thermobifida halotolerans]UOE18087.1 VOC family protein [Thermobifida halotolerans]